MVEERFVEAAAVMKRLPEVRVPGYFNTWPKMVVEFADRVGQQPEPMRLPPPSPDAISRMEETLGWLHWLEPIDAKIVWLRATGERWKAICWRLASGARLLTSMAIRAVRDRVALNGRQGPEQAVTPVHRCESTSREL